MTNLKNDNLEKCFSLLKGFIDGAPVKENKKKVAVLALDHMLRVKAGTEIDPGPGTHKCNGRPRADVA